MTVAVVTGLKPGVKGLVQTFNATPMEEGSGIEKDDRGDPNEADYREIETGPLLLYWPVINYWSNCQAFAAFNQRVTKPRQFLLWPKT